MSEYPYTTIYTIDTLLFTHPPHIIESYPQNVDKMSITSWGHYEGPYFFPEFSNIYDFGGVFLGNSLFFAIFLAIFAILYIFHNT